MNEIKFTPESSIAPEPLQGTNADITPSLATPSVVERTPNPVLNTELPVEASLVEARENGEVYKLVGMPVELGFTALRAVGMQLDNEMAKDVENEDTQLAEEQLRLAFTTTGEKRTDFIPVETGKITIDALSAVVSEQKDTPEGVAAEKALEAFKEVASASKIAA